ncbi:MAG: hypothetical protein ACRD2U_16735 [Terriglobales bacterium]
MNTHRISRLAVMAFAAFVILIIPMPAFSQGCPLCYTQAASAGARMIQALRNGIIVLMIPPACMSVAISVFAYRKRNQFKREGYTVESDERW